MSFGIKEDRYAEEESTLLRRLSRSCGRSTCWSLRDWGGEVTYYRWRQEYGGLKTEQVKRLKELETENTRLCRAISDLTLDKLILQEAARGNF